MRLQETADAIRRKRGIYAPSNPLPDDESALAPGEPRVVPVDVPPEYSAPKDDGQIHDPELEAAAAELKSVPPGSVPGQVGKTLMGATPPQPQDDGLYGAQEADRKSHLTAGMELAGRQLVGALTRTAVPQGIGAAPSQVPAAMDAAKTRRAAVADALNRKRQGEQDEQSAKLAGSTMALHESEIEKNRRTPAAKPEDPLAAPLKVAQTEHLKAETEDLKAKPGREASRAARLAAAVKAKQEAAAKAEGVAVESSKIPAFGGMFVPRAGTKPDKELAKQASLHAGLYNAAVSGMDDLGGAVRAYVAHPSPDTKRDIDAKVSGVAAAVTAAHGGGAMATDEFDRQKNALGADPTSIAAMQALISEALGSPDGAKSLISKLNSSRSSMIQMARGKLASANYEFQGGEEEAPPKSAPVKFLVSPDKKRRVPVFADGSKGPEEANPNGG